MVELAYTTDLSSVASQLGGSTPSTCTKIPQLNHYVQSLLSMHNFMFGKIRLAKVVIYIQGLTKTYHQIVRSYVGYITIYLSSLC